MNSIELNEFSQLAVASYYDLTGGAPGTDILKDSGKGMASTQANAFNAKYTILLPTYHDPLSDLDVTVFKDVAGNLTLGIRGTSPGHDLTVTDGRIAAKGAAYDQIVALYNWWKSVSTPQGQQVKQFTLVAYPNGPLTAPPPGSVLLFPTSPDFSMYLVAAPMVRATGTLTTALTADPDHQVDVVDSGHFEGLQKPASSLQAVVKENRGGCLMTFNAWIERFGLLLFPAMGLLEAPLLNEPEGYTQLTRRGRVCTAQCQTF